MNDIYKLASKYCNNPQECTPEGILYGLVKLSTMSEMALKFLFREAAIQDTDSVKKEISKIRELLVKEDIDIDLIKAEAKELLPLIEQEGADKSGFKVVSQKYDDNTSVEQIINDILKSIDNETISMFRNGSTREDVISYRNHLFEKHKEITEGLTDDPKNTEEATKSTKAETIDTGEKSSVSKEAPDAGNDQTDNERINKNIVFNERLDAYLREIKDMIPVFRKTENESYLFSQSLLVSIDEGYGFSSFSQELAQVYIDAGLSSKTKAGDLVKELKIDEIKKTMDEPRSLSDVLKLVNTYYNERTRGRLGLIISADISALLPVIDTDEFRKIIRQIGQKSSSVLLVFRIPYMEHNVLADVEAIMLDVLGIKTLSVPPVPTDRLVEYIIDNVEADGFLFDKKSREQLENGIVAEKNDGHFYGFHTLNKMHDTIIYEKLRYNAIKHSDDKIINTKQLKEFLKLTDRIPDHEQMLKRMVGVDEIIRQIDDKIKQIKTSQKLSDDNVDVERPSIHMMFRGNPGTGKTTMARIVAAKLKDAGILSKGHLYEIKGRDLCGRYVGETTPKTCAYCRDAYGSVLFIDEAYELYRSGDADSHDFGHEALAALVAEMENHRDDMCVILAGYTDDMNEMLKGNIGLKDRIPIIIDFPNDTREQLKEIFFKMMDSRFKYENRLEEVVAEYFDSIDEEMLNNKEFSNARFVRNLYESTWGEAATRYDLNSSNKLVIKCSDFKNAAAKINLRSAADKKRRPIGFVTD